MARYTIHHTIPSQTSDWPQSLQLSHIIHISFSQPLQCSLQIKPPLKLEAAHGPETSEHIYPPRCNNAEDRHMNNTRHEKLNVSNPCVIYCLFNVSVSSSDYTVSSARIIDK